MSYRVRITGAMPGRRGALRLACVVEREEDGSWVGVSGAPGHLDVDAAAVLQVLHEEATEAEKRTALMEVIRKAARGHEDVVAVVAIGQVEALLPTGWPVTVEL